MLDTYGYKHTPRICSNYCSSTARMFARTRHSVTMHVHYMSCFAYDGLKYLGTIITNDDNLFSKSFKYPVKFWKCQPPFIKARLSIRFLPRKKHTKQNKTKQNKTKLQSTSNLKDCHPRCACRNYI